MVRTWDLTLASALMLSAMTAGSSPQEQVVSSRKVAAEKKSPENSAAKKPDAQKLAAERQRAATYVHVVTIPLMKDAPEDTGEKLIADCHILLGKIPSVRAVKAGRPAEKDSVDFVKKDYSVGLIVLFDDHDGLKAYLVHPLHLQLVEKYRKFIDFEHARVFDFVDGK
jgi:hypothetical protein